MDEVEKVEAEPEAEPEPTKEELEEVKAEQSYFTSIILLLNDYRNSVGFGNFFSGSNLKKMGQTQVGKIRHSSVSIRFSGFSHNSF